MPLELYNIQKSYRNTRVIRNLSVAFPEGAITALVGPNGSGKTTLLKSILGLVIAEKGEIKWNGKSIAGDHLFRKNIGYMPQMPEFPGNLKVHELFKMVRQLHAGEQEDPEMLDIFNYKELESKALGTLSGGQRQKVNAMLCFLFSPALLILDEPTSALDPISSEHFKNKLEAEKKKGKTILITSHLMNEMEQLADKLLYLLDGNIVIDSTVESLKQSTHSERLGEALLKMLNKNE
ncbi:MAG: ABC transporter ATP-binding protein [Bacteroidia bacterium]|jgi:Cu-processing system ATP-binding protein|nr:ABC transporter ATP-binding protein [Bacteroidia bacterium]